MAERAQLPIWDLYTASFLARSGIEPEVVRQGTRAVFLFPANEQTYKTLADYQTQTELLDFVAALRRLRARMLDVRG